MKQFLKSYLVLIALIILVSCESSNESPIIPTPILGAWERSDFIEEWGLIVGSKYTFNSDKTYTSHGFYKNPDSKETVGYYHYIKGNYTLEGDEITLLPNETYFMPENSENFYGTLELLEIREGNFELEANYFLENDNKKLVIKFKPCGPEANCISLLEYAKL